MTALDDLTALVVSLPNAPLLTDTMKQDALNAALIPDVNNVWPGSDGYQTTYDIYFAATRLIGFLMAQPVVRQSSSEGTSVAVDAPNWQQLLTYYGSMSLILGVRQQAVLTEVIIPDSRRIVRVDMHNDDGSEYYDNVDTDVD